MFVAQYLHHTGDKDSSFSIYGPWMPRSADIIRFILDLIQVQNAKLTVELFDRTLEGTGDGTATGAAISGVTALQLHQADFAGCKEMVRFKFTITLTATGTGFVAFRMLNSVWFNSTRV